MSNNVYSIFKPAGYNIPTGLDFGIQCPYWRS